MQTEQKVVKNSNWGKVDHYLQGIEESGATTNTNPSSGRKEDSGTLARRKTFLKACEC